MTFKRILTILAAAAMAMGARADIVINEIMQSNIDCIMDDLNEFPDSWVELYNSGTADVNIVGWKIGLKKDPEKAYTLPSAVVRAGGHLIIYCDKENSSEPSLHTDFRLDSGKGDLFLFDADGNKVDALEGIKKQPAPNVAYGRKSDGHEKWGYELTPTPGSANGGGLSSTVLPEVEFSEHGGVWNGKQNITLALTVPDAPEGTTIRFTIDGTEPTASNGALYNGPFTINSSRVIRARAFAEGCISCPSNMESYIFMDRKPKIPVISIAIDPKYLYNNEIGIFVDGSGGEYRENWRYDWRRPLLLQYFDGEGQAASLNQLCETRIQGGATRANPLKSMAVYANKRFGTKRFDHELWAKDKPGVNDIKSFILRNGGNDFCWAYVRDAVAQRIIARNTTGLDWQGYAPVLVFINGKYHAMMGLRERSNEDNIYSNHGGLENIDMFENWWQLKEGDWNNYVEFSEFINGKARTVEEWSTWIDVDSYVNMMAISFWGYNHDFPNNNVCMWRDRTEGADGRWRWLLKDCDFCFGAWNSEENVARSYHDFLMSNNTEAGNKFYRSFMRLPGNTEYFVDHLVAYMGSFMNATYAATVIDEIVDENCGEQERSHMIWRETIGYGWSYYKNNIEFMKQWCVKRDAAMPALMQQSYGLGKAVHVRINKDIDPLSVEGARIVYDNVLLPDAFFSGYDYAGRTLTLSTAEGSTICGWTVKRSGAPEQTFDMAEISLEIGESDSQITINAITAESAVRDIVADAAEPSFSVSGRTVSAGAPITVTDIAGRTVASGESSATISVPGIYIIAVDGAAPAKIAIR